MFRFKFREIALITVPVLFIGGFGWWANVRQTERTARENGPYRTQLVSIEDLPLTPFERWQGFDAKVRIVATDDGKPALPTGVKLDGRRELDGEIFLVGSSDNGETKLPISTSGIGTDGINSRNQGALLRIYDFGKSRQESENLDLTFLADTDAVPGAKVKLQGQARVENGTYRNPKLASVAGFEVWRGVAGIYTFTARPVEIEHLLLASKKPVDRTAPMLLSTQIARLSPRETATDLAGDNGDTFVEATFDCSALGLDKPEFLFAETRFADPILEDEFGKEVEKLHISGASYGRDGQMNFHDRVKTFRIPANRGQIILKTWFSYRDSWPTPVSIVVRPRPHTAAPRKLQLQSAKLVETSGDYSVEARVRYTGALPLETEQNADMQNISVFLNARLAPRAAGTDRLLSDWSQHLEFAGGKTQWSDQYVGDARAECDADNACVVTYPIPAMKQWTPGQSARFRAQIGVEDDGFLDIDLPVTRAK